VLQFRSVDLAGNTELLRSVEVKVVTLDGMSSGITAYAGSVGIQLTFAGQLNYRFSIIRLLDAQGSLQTAIAYMNDFLAQNRDSSVWQQGLISETDFDTLQDSAVRWIEAMKPRGEERNEIERTVARDRSVLYVRVLYIGLVSGCELAHPCELRVC
jgi:hypothetical protein